MDDTKQVTVAGGMVRISLVMATEGRSDEIHRFLASLEKQTSNAFELIIVDQNDDNRLEPIVERARAAGMDVTHIRHPVKNLSMARNAGTAIAKYELIAFPDDDCWYDDRVVEGVVSRFEYDAELDGLIARWVEEDPVGQDSQQLSFAEYRQFRGVQTSSITLFLRKFLVRKVGGFDDRLGMPTWFGSGEETDLVLRSLAQGATLRYMADIMVHHAYESSLPSNMQHIYKRARNRARGTGALYARHRLSLHVIMRGLLSPLIKIFAPPYSIRSTLVNFCIALGRAEGFFRWTCTVGRSRNDGELGA